MGPHVHLGVACVRRGAQLPHAALGAARPRQQTATVVTAPTSGVASNGAACEVARRRKHDMRKGMARLAIADAGRNDDGRRACSVGGHGYCYARAAENENGTRERKTGLELHVRHRKRSGAARGTRWCRTNRGSSSASDPLRSMCATCSGSALGSHDDNDLNCSNAMDVTRVDFR